MTKLLAWHRLEKFVKLMQLSILIPDRCIRESEKGDLIKIF